MSNYSRFVRLFFVSAAALLITVSVTEGLFEAAAMQVGMVVRHGSAFRTLMRKGKPSRRAVMEKKDLTNKDQVK